MVTSLAPAPYNDRFARVFGSSLTPQQVTQVLDQSSIGYMWGQADLLDEMRERDGHLHAELQKRELRVAGAPWELTPPEGAGAMGVEIARWCTARLNDIEARGDLDRSWAGHPWHGINWQRAWRQVEPEVLAARGLRPRGAPRAAGRSPTRSRGFTRGASRTPPTGGSICGTRAGRHRRATRPPR